MMTREEFEDAVDDLVVAVQIDRGHETDRDYLLAAFDTQAARIAQLEREVHLVRERNAELAAQRLEADDRAYYEGRIAELEAQRDALLVACKAEVAYGERGEGRGGDVVEMARAAIAMVRGGEK